MNYISITAQIDDNDRRIDTVIRKVLTEMPLTLVYKNIRTGFIRLNDRKTTIGARVHTGDRICIAEVIYAPYTPTLKSPALPVSPKNESPVTIATIFKNEHIWILNKSAGISVQKAKKDELSLDDIVRDLSTIPPSLSFSPGPLHRLDRNTTGIICFSQSLLGARWFSTQMKEGAIHKYYRGLAQGRLEKEEEWKDGIEKSTIHENFHTVHITDGDSITRAKPLAHGTFLHENISLIEYEIIGGKTHQIRAQSAHHGFPLFGDSAYGGYMNDAVSSFFLHASRLEFPKNDLDIPLILECPLPQKFVNTLKICLPKDDTARIL